MDSLGFFHYLMEQDNLRVVYFGRSWDNAPETGSGTNRVRPNLGQNFLESD
ncbi:hypothetical protein J6590_023179 [Homalodisca vitripennis]|nr:hypothetical protein J6590_023179 [Homalodisca vitripennis]